MHWIALSSCELGLHSFDHIFILHFPCKHIPLSKIKTNRAPSAFTMCLKLYQVVQDNFALTKISKCRKWHLRGLYFLHFQGEGMPSELPRGSSLRHSLSRLCHTQNLRFLFQRVRISEKVPPLLF